MFGGIGAPPLNCGIDHWQIAGLISQSQMVRFHLPQPVKPALSRFFFACHSRSVAMLTEDDLAAIAANVQAFVLRMGMGTGHHSSERRRDDSELFEADDLDDRID